MRAQLGALWAEPLNAVTSAAFLVAAVAAFVLWRRAGRSGDWPVLALIAVTVAIAVSSALLHTLATRWAGLVHVISLEVFMLGYLALALRRFFGLGFAGTMVGLMLCSSVSPPVLRWIEPVAEPWLGSLRYVPALVGLAALGAAGRMLKVAAGARDAAATLLAAAGLFALSLLLRAADQPLCGVLPAGTHFVWHVLNAAVIYLLLRAAILHRPAA